jgi:hypothetical protein
MLMLTLAVGTSPTFWKPNMSVTLLERIEYAEKQRREIAERLAEQDAVIAELKSYRFECDHDFASALKGYEHEGGHCIKCGINAVYWECNKDKK